MFKNHTNRFGVACIWLDERMGTQRDITSPLKPPSHTSKHKKHTYACNQASIRTNNVCLKKQGSKQAGLCMQSGGKSGKQTGRQAWVCSLLCCCSDKKDILFFSPAKKAYNKPSPHHRNIKAKETQPLHTCTAHDTTWDNNKRGILNNIILNTKSWWRRRTTMMMMSICDVQLQVWGWCK